MTNRLCVVCNTDKPQEEFTKASWGLGRRTCRICYNSKNSIARKVIGSDARRKQYWAIKIVSIRKECARRNIPFDITARFMMELWDTQQGRCAISGIEFAPIAQGQGLPRNGACRWNLGSIDRIEPLIGYVPGNVRLILYCLNSFRGVMQDGQMYDIMILTLKKQGLI